MAKHGHYGDRPGHTLQGIYVCSASGEFLASVNSTNADSVLRMMQRGLRAWKAMPENKRKLSADSEFKPRHRWEDSYPENGLVVSVVTRDLPAQCDPSSPCEVRWNRDFVWFSQQEARQWLPQNPEVGQTQTLPAKFTARITRFHLVDTVNGQTTHYNKREVKDSEISTRVTRLEDNHVHLEIFGKTKANSPGQRAHESPHGVVTQLLGRATYDLQRRVFEEFEIVALGRRWGHTQFNVRRNDEESGPLGYVFRLTSEKTPHVAPAFLHAYEADWVRRSRR